jgi:ubiquinol-cytochrome c reductase core subunit 2
VLCIHGSTRGSRMYALRAQICFPAALRTLWYSHHRLQSTGKRSALGTVREAELYGGVLSSSLSREHLALTAEFLRGDEYVAFRFQNILTYLIYDHHRAYFVDVLASFLASPKFTRHELNEYVLPAVHSESAAATHSAPTHALELAHALAFRNGLGNSLYADEHATANITAEDIRDLHARAVGNPSGVAVLGTGISTESLAKLLESSYSAHKKTTTATTIPETHATAYHGGAARIASAHGQQTIFVGFGSTSTASVPALHALAAHLNPSPSLKWSTSSTSPLAPSIPSGVSAHSILLPYTDASLIGVMLTGTDASALKEGAKAVVQAFRDTAEGKGVGKEELGRAVARAKFQVAAAVEGREGMVGTFGPKVLRGEKVSVQATLEGVQGVSGTSLSQVRAVRSPLVLMLMCVATGRGGAG